MSDSLRKHQYNNCLEHHKKQFRDQAHHQGQGLGVWGFEEYEEDAWSYYNKHTALVLATLGLAGFGLVYLNQTYREKWEDIAFSSW